MKTKKTITKKNTAKKDNFDMIRKAIKNAIENEQTSRIKELLSLTNRRIIFSKETKFWRLTRLPVQIQADLFTIERSISNCLNSGAIIDSDYKILTRKKVKLNNHRINRCSKRPRIFKKINKIDWRNFYVDEDLGDNALHYACRLGKICFIDLLLDSGYFVIDDVNISLEQDTPLTIACDFGWLDAVKILVMRGADVDYENGSFKTPLILSTELISPYDTQMAKLLVSHGANVKYVTRDGNEAILSAIRYGNIELVKYLLECDLEPNCVFKKIDLSALMSACYYNKPDIVKYLIERGAHCEFANSRNQTPLFIASKQGYVDLVKLLVINYKANINHSDQDGDVPLSIACYVNKESVVEFLLQNDPNVNKTNKNGETPLLIAVSNCSLSVVKMLIEYGADVDLYNNQNETCLHVAIKLGRIDVFNVLLKHAHRLDVYSMKDYATPIRMLLDKLNKEKLIMALDLVKAGCELNRSFNRNVFEVSDFACPFETTCEVSPFKLLFETASSRFNFKESITDDQSNRMPFDLYIDLIHLILKSDIKLNKNDYETWKKSWVCEHLRTNKPNLAIYIETRLFKGLTRPGPLINLCRSRVRSALQKPLEKSIRNLNVSNHLKYFLSLEF